MAYDGKWKIILCYSDFDDELEMLAVVAMAMENSILRIVPQYVVVLFKVILLFFAIELKGMRDFIAIILLNSLPIPQNYFEEGFE